MEGNSPSHSVKREKPSPSSWHQSQFLTGAASWRNCSEPHRMLCTKSKDIENDTHTYRISFCPDWKEELSSTGNAIVWGNPLPQCILTVWEGRWHPDIHHNKNAMVLFPRAAAFHVWKGQRSPFWPEIKLLLIHYAHCPDESPKKEPKFTLGMQRSVSKFTPSLLSVNREMASLAPNSILGSLPHYLDAASAWVLL